MSDDKSPDPRARSGTHTEPGGAGKADDGRAIASVLPLPGEAIDQDKRLDELLPIGISPLAVTGPGRPRGARNRRTDLVAQYLVDRFGDPLTASMATAGMPLRDLIRELRTIASDVGMKLGGSVMDIARFQRDCRNDALPYIHAKRAPETFKGDPVVPVVAIGRFEQHNTVINGAAKSMEERLAELDGNVEQDQSVTTIEGEVSHDGKSHDAS